MSVVVQKLTKEYGLQKAIDQLSFGVESGQVVGFLGPNGAGKTTTMKIITGYLPASSGSVEVCGFDVVKNPLEVRKRIGYLPENNPLYLDMYVREYLHFIASLHRLSSKMMRVNEVIEITGLQREAHKRLHMLSKGYRQRVGLAQAMIHDPEVLILDEPTSGLDPNQLVEIRNLIRSLGKEKTVIFSTHIMQEVQAICDRVIIINQGQIVGDDSIQMLSTLVHKEIAVEVEFSREVFQNSLLTIPGVIRVEEIGDHRVLLYANDGTDLRPKIFDFAVSKTLQIIEMFQRKSTVEDVFQELTKNP